MKKFILYLSTLFSLFCLCSCSFYGNEISSTSITDNIKTVHIFSIGKCVHFTESFSYNHSRCFYTFEYGKLYATEYCLIDNTCPWCDSE